ncbi:putative ribonuclease H-like domain-containing protein [Tanacetum coccineum]|uniref:Ribonuclease H-like domain-containing protein n=1 Tax=Tanacetum coccineum TaxID=301880 RepID=A0ABQ4ZEM5_9ASTR
MQGELECATWYWRVSGGCKGLLNDFTSMEEWVEARLGRRHALCFMRPFGCPVTILNTIDHLGKFDEKADEGFFVGYSTNSKAFRVFNSRTRIVEENLHDKFNEYTTNIEGSTEACNNAGKARMETVPGKDYILLQLWAADPPLSQSLKDSSDVGFKPSGEEEKKDNEEPGKEEDTDVDENIIYGCVDDPNMAALEEIVYSDNDEDVDAEADMNNLDTYIPVSPIPTTRVHKDHPLEQEELLQFKLQEVWTLVELPNGRTIGTKWVFGNKKDERGIVIKNKARFVAQGYTQEEGIDYDEEVYVCQPPGFGDSDFPNRVYKVEKALYGLHRASRAWDKSDMLLVQVYVDDIIFGFTRKEMCTEFEKMMHKKFQMSSMGELTFFLDLQVKQKEDGIFISQDNTPMETHKPLLNDTDGEDIDEHLYRSMIGSLMYLTSSRLDIMFAVCACARFQVNPKISHLYVVKRIFRYLKGQPKLGLWYPKNSPFDLVVYTDSDYARASLDRKSTIGDKVVHEERGDSVERAVTTASSLEAEQDSSNITRTQSTAMPNVPLPKGIGSGGRPMRQETMGDRPAQTRVLALETTKTAQAKKIASLKKRVKQLERKIKLRTPGRNLFKIGTSRRRSLGKEDASKQGKSKIHRKQSSIFEDNDFDEEFDANMDEPIKQVYDANKDTVEEGEVQVSIGDAINTADMEVNTASTLVTTASINITTAEPITTASAPITAAGVSVSTAEPSTPPTTTTTTTTVIEDEDLIIAQTLMKMKSEKSKVNGVTMQEPSKTSSRPTVSPPQHDPKDKEEEERLAKQREEDANIAEWDDVQAMMDADYELAARLQEEEQGELTIE